MTILSLRWIMLIWKTTTQIWEYRLYHRRPLRISWNRLAQPSYKVSIIIIRSRWAFIIATVKQNKDKAPILWCMGKMAQLVILKVRWIWYSRNKICCLKIIWTRQVPSNESTLSPKTTKNWPSKDHKSWKSKV